MRYIYNGQDQRHISLCDTGASRVTPLEKMQEKTLMASLRRRLKNQDEPALPPASSLCYEHSPLEPHPSHIYPSVSHKGNTNVLNMQDIQRKTIGLVAQSILSAMIFTAFTASISPKRCCHLLSLPPSTFWGISPPHLPLRYYMH